MWGIVPAAGSGSRIQPLAFSKELLPVGGRAQGEAQRPCAVSEYLVQRMILGGADKICFVIAPDKSDIMEYYGSDFSTATIAYVVQERPTGLCDAIFRAHPLIPKSAESLIVGLPDTVWFPENALHGLPEGILSFLLFPVAQPELFDAVILDDKDRVQEIRVKQQNPGSEWIWGAFKMPGFVFHELKSLWESRSRQDEYVGTLINAYIAAGGDAVGCKGGETYVDVGNLRGYRTAMHLLSEHASADDDELTAVPTRSHSNAGALRGQP